MDVLCNNNVLLYLLASSNKLSSLLAWYLSRHSWQLVRTIVFSCYGGWRPLAAERGFTAAQWCIFIAILFNLVIWLKQILRFEFWIYLILNSVYSHYSVACVTKSVIKTWTRCVISPKRSSKNWGTSSKSLDVRSSARVRWPRGRGGRPVSAALHRDDNQRACALSTIAICAIPALLSHIVALYLWLSVFASY